VKLTTPWVHVALLLVSLIYGATFSLAKVVMPAFIGAYGFILIRVSVAAVVFWLVWLLVIRQKIRPLSDLYRFAICAIFGVATNMLLFFKGLSLTTPINASVIMLTTPVLVVLISVLWKVEAFTKRIGVGIATAMIGAFLLIGGWNMQFSGQGALGDFLVFLNATSLAIYFVYVKRLLKRYHPITITTFAFSFGWFMVLPFGWNEVSVVEWIELTHFAWFSLAFVVLATTVLAYFLNAWAMSKTTPSVVGSYIYLQPVFATVIAISLGKDALTFEKVIFAATIFSGVYLINSRKKKNT
jgi:drug/metabolite transporter (DMT)-like permease